MKCPKCGYTSFDYLDECKKCGKSLEDHKEKYRIRSLMFPVTGAAAASVAAAGAPAAEGGEEFGFDFMEEETAGAASEPATEVTEDDTFDFGEEDDSFSFGDDDDTF